MKIAIIRGANLNEYEMQNYRPLVSSDLKLTGFTSKGSRAGATRVGFPVIKLPMLKEFCRFAKYRGALNKLFGDDQIMLGLEEKLTGFDIAHTAETHNYYTHQVVKAKLAGRVKKVVVTVWENVPLVGSYNPRQAKLKEIVLKHTDLFHAVTERARQSLILDGVSPDKIKLLFYGVDHQRFRPQERSKQLLSKLGLNSNDIIILSVGRLVWEKGFDHILFAAAKLLNDPQIPRDRIKFLFVGRGPRRPILEEQIEKLGLTKHIVWGDHLPYEQVPQIHALADIFLLPSLPLYNWQEQFGIVFIESMASGIPVIAGRSGSIPEIIGDAGILVQPGDMLSISHALKKLILDRDLRKKYSQAALTRAAEFFDAKKVAAKLETLYR